MQRRIGLRLASVGSCQNHHHYACASEAEGNAKPLCSAPRSIGAVGSTSTATEVARKVLEAVFDHEAKGHAKGDDRTSDEHKKNCPWRPSLSCHAFIHFVRLAS